jgi:hypothetical protein
MPPRKIILGTCALNECTVNEGLIILGDEFNTVTVKGGYNMFHRGCNPNPEPVETVETEAA